MRIRLDRYIYDTGSKIWGGDIHEGLSKSSFLCPGYNTKSSYLDKKLPAKARKAVEEHLASCKECRNDILELRKMINDLNFEIEMERKNVH